jgi:hypothetical protein
MGDHFQIIVAQDVSLDQAEFLASKIQKWLVDEGIIEAIATNDCVLGNGLGYPPGPNCINIVENADLFPENYWTDGLEIITERTVFHPGQGGIEQVICPYCNTYIADEIYFKAVVEAIDNWYAGNEGRLQCSNCGVMTPVIQWGFEPIWGFGNLGFKFWNWPRLKDSFVANLSEQLGHQTLLVAGKL